MLKKPLIAYLQLSSLSMGRIMGSLMQDNYNIRIMILNSIMLYPKFISFFVLSFNVRVCSKRDVLSFDIHHFLIPNGKLRYQTCVIQGKYLIRKALNVWLQILRTIVMKIVF